MGAMEIIEENEKIVVLKDGKEVECDILFTFDSEDTGKSYIGYTDNSSIGADNVQAAIDGTCTKFSNQLATLESSIINKIYPIGSIYISETDSTVAEV